MKPEIGGRRRPGETRNRGAGAGEPGIGGAGGQVKPGIRGAGGQVKPGKGAQEGR